MAEEQLPTSNQSNNHHNHLARYSEYRPGELARYIGHDGNFVEGKVLHVSDRVDGQIYLIESQRGFPDVVLASSMNAQ